MERYDQGADLRAAVHTWRLQGLRVGFVPTMGNLHAGHYSLVELARRHTDRVVASVFVNPTQFGPNEDYARYPRTLEADQAGLAAVGCDALYAPAVEEIYPYGVGHTSVLHVPQITAPLEGEFRPGHFDGVATVVSKLFHRVQPDVAVFGRKDYQQLLTIRRLVRDAGLPVEIVAAPTQREADGLALSSRNQYLAPDERTRAATIYACLTAMRDAHAAGAPAADIEAAARARLTAAGFVVDYAALRRDGDLAPVDDAHRDGWVALIAARLGRTRLIDNLAFDPV